MRFQHLDSEQVVNNPVYLDYCSDCGFATTSHFGWPVSRMIDNGFGIFYRTIDIEYLQPAVLDDQLDVAAWLSDIKRVTGMRHFAITRARDGAPIARANALCVCADLKTGGPTRWPESVRADLAANVSA